MTNIDTKIQRFIKEFDNFKEDSTDERYWLDQRCLILLSHIHLEYLLNKLLKQEGFSNWLENKPFIGFYDKAIKLKDILIENNLYQPLIDFNKARNTIGHELTIIDKLNNISFNFLGITSTKVEFIRLFFGLSKLIKKEFWED